MNTKQGQSAEGQIKLIETETKSKLKPLEDDLKNITEQINILEERKQGYALDDEAKDKKLRNLKDQKLELITNENGDGIYPMTVQIVGKGSLYDPNNEKVRS